MTRFLAQDNIFYHGTYNKFLMFRPLSHFGSVQAAKLIVNQKVKKSEIINLYNNPFIYNKNTYIKYDDASSAEVIPVKLRLKNTYELQDIEAAHDKLFFSNLLLFHFIKDLKNTKLPGLYDYITKEPFTKLSLQNVKYELLTDNLYDLKEGNSLQDEMINRYHLFLQRMIHYFESLGFDGFHYTNHYEDAGHISYVAFRPENVIRLDINSVKEKYKINNKNDLTYNVRFDRDLTKEENINLKFEILYQMENITEKKLLLDKHKDIFLRPSSFRQIMREKLYYSQLLFSEILPKIEKITNQSKYGYHGLTHTAQVCMFGTELALSVQQDPLPVLLAAGLHDCARVNDEYCEMHGPRCEPIARKFLSENYPSLLPSEVESIIMAVKNHTIGRNADDLVSACLWDADRIRLSWEMGYAPEFFSTPYGHKIASLSFNQQREYNANQERFLIDNKIKTRAQLDYDKVMDAKQNLLGTVFNVKEK